MRQWLISCSARARRTESDFLPAENCDLSPVLHQDAALSIRGTAVPHLEAKTDTHTQAVAAFIERWSRSEGGEHRTYPMFLTELGDLLRVAKPETVGDDYCFERKVRITNWDGSSSLGRIDLYKRGCFVLEAKQGTFKPAPDHPTLPG